MSEDATLQGLEGPPPRRRYMLTESEAQLIDRRRRETRDTLARRTWLKRTILANLRYPTGQSQLHRLLCAGRMGRISYHLVGELLQELSREGRVIRVRRSKGWRRV